jgi:hypothetical protein
VVEMIISAHGVRPETGLTKAQKSLISSDSIVRVCQSPTGLGKTYSFIEAAKKGHAIVFIVPTNALAKSVLEDMEKADITHRYLWDGTKDGKSSGGQKETWYKRSNDWENVSRNGGVVVTTPETFGQIFHDSFAGSTVSAKPSLNNFFGSEKHPIDIVFDEFHTYSAPALGFIRFWCAFSVWRKKNVTSKSIKPTLKTTLLSATMSNMINPVLDLKEDFLIPDNIDGEYIPTAEKFENGTFFGYTNDGLLSFLVDEIVCVEEDPKIRYLHGDVSIEPIGRNAIWTKLEESLILAKKNKTKVLILFDSLRHSSEQDKEDSSMSMAIKNAGLSPKNVLLINGMDKQSEQTSLGNSGFRAGLDPNDNEEHETILVVGTSSVEAGLNIKNLREAFIDPGFDAASFLQRIGRVARGNCPGRIFVIDPEKEHLVWNSIYEDLRSEKKLKITDFLKNFAVLRDVNGERARCLGDSYIYTIQNKRKDLKNDQGIKIVNMWKTNRIGHRYVDISIVDKALQKTKKESKNTKFIMASEKWLKLVYRRLLDFREFSNTICISFKDKPIISYSKQWADKNLKYPHSVSEDSEGIVWSYECTRDKALREEPQEYWVHVVVPDFRSGDITSLSVRVTKWDISAQTKAVEAISEFFLAEINHSMNESKTEFLKKAKAFIEQSHLIVYQNETATPSPQILY